MKYIPQDPPFEMIDGLVETNERFTRSRFLIQPETVFVEENGHFSEAGLIENMAQTAAAGMGFTAAKTEKKPPVGFIGQIKNIAILKLPKIGALLETSISYEFIVMNAHIVKGKVEENGIVIAEAEFKIFLQE